MTEHPKIKPLIDSSERAHRVFKMTEYQGMNVSSSAVLIYECFAQSVCSTRSCTPSSAGNEHSQEC